MHALRATALGLFIAVAIFAAAVALVSVDAWQRTTGVAWAASIAVSALGLSAAAILSLRAQSAAARGCMEPALIAAFFAVCALLTAPASQLYRQVDRWQDLASIGHAIEADAAAGP